MTEQRLRQGGSSGIGELGYAPTACFGSSEVTIPDADRSSQDDFGKRAGEVLEAPGLDSPARHFLERLT